MITQNIKRDAPAKPQYNLRPVYQLRRKGQEAWYDIKEQQYQRHQQDAAARGLNEYRVLYQKV